MEKILITVPPEIEAQAKELQKEIFPDKSLIGIYATALKRGLDLAQQTKEAK